MTREEAIKVINGLRIPCAVTINGHSCDRNEAIDMAIEALSADGDLISRADAINAVMAESRKVYTSEYANAERIIYEADAVEALAMLPSADAVQGEWEDREVFNETDDDHIVEEWQSARCSVCGKYHTTPYMYYFDDFNYCPMCGARMKGESHDG